MLFSLGHSVEEPKFEKLLQNCCYRKYMCRLESHRLSNLAIFLYVALIRNVITAEVIRLFSPIRSSNHKVFFFFFILFISRLLGRISKVDNRQSLQANKKIPKVSVLCTTFVESFGHTWCSFVWGHDLIMTLSWTESAYLVEKQLYESLTDWKLHKIIYLDNYNQCSVVRQFGTVDLDQDLFVSCTGW